MKLYSKIRLYDDVAIYETEKLKKTFDLFSTEVIITENLLSNEWNHSVKDAEGIWKIVELNKTLANICSRTVATQLGV